MDVVRRSPLPAGPAGARPRILFVSHAQTPTGFARVAHSILRELSPRWDLHQYAINRLTDAPNPGWPVYANPNPADVHDNEGLAAVIAAVQPDIVLVIDEAWVARHRAPLLNSVNAKVIYYCAIDSETPLSSEAMRALASSDAVVAFTRLGRSVLERQLGRLDVHVIPHGVDIELFHPLPGGRRVARAQLFPGRPELLDAFLVLNANRNQPYKRIERTLEGFALFAAGKPPNVMLYLHMGSRPCPEGATPLVDQLGIRHRVLSTTTGPAHPNVPSPQLNQIYNACDVGVNTSEKEGWGLVSFEHAATGAAQIVPRHSACQELWADSALLLDAVTPAVVAQALEQLYTGPLEHWRRAALANATRPEYRWSGIAAQWDQLFLELLAAKRTERSQASSA